MNALNRIALLCTALVIYSTLAMCHSAKLIDLLLRKNKTERQLRLPFPAAVNSSRFF
jgi:hypothetical protein